MLPLINIKILAQVNDRKKYLEKVNDAIVIINYFAQHGFIAWMHSAGKGLDDAGVKCENVIWNDIHRDFFIKRKLCNILVNGNAAEQKAFLEKLVALGPSKSELKITSLAKLIEVANSRGVFLRMHADEIAVMTVFLSELTYLLQSARSVFKGQHLAMQELEKVSEATISQIDKLYSSMEAILELENNSAPKKSAQSTWLDYHQTKNRPQFLPTIVDQTRYFKQSLNALADENIFSFEDTWVDDSLSTKLFQLPPQFKGSKEYDSALTVKDFFENCLGIENSHASPSKDNELSDNSRLLEEEFDRLSPAEWVRIDSPALSPRPLTLEDRVIEADRKIDGLNQCIAMLKERWDDKFNRLVMQQMKMESAQRQSGFRSSQG